MSNTTLWNTEAYRTVLRAKLFDAVSRSGARFDHIKIAQLGDQVAVFVVKGNQSTVIYDKTDGFPSAKLMASLILLGSP
jgi:hypothetical protein